MCVLGVVRQDGRWQSQALPVLIGASHVTSDHGAAYPAIVAWTDQERKGQPQKGTPVRYFSGEGYV